MRPASRRWLAPLVAVLGLVGCNFGLDDPTLVQTPRILAIVADHPEAAPGEDVVVHVMGYDPMQREIHYAYRVCLDASSFLGSTTNGTGGMAAQMGVCTPWSDPSTSDLWTMPGAFTQQLVMLIDSIPPGSGIDPALLHRVLDTAGLPVKVEVHLSVTGPEGTEAVLVTATKQIGITTRAQPTTNPPYVYFLIGDVPYFGGLDPHGSFECRPWFAEPATFEASPPEGDLTPVILSPLDDPSTWMESFPIYDFSGNVRTGYEGSYYSWYSTSYFTDAHGRHSTLHTETTQGPSHGAEPSPSDATARDNTWDVPREAGTYDLWVIARDGHLGTAACHTTIEVTARP